MGGVLLDKLKYPSQYESNRSSIDVIGNFTWAIDECNNGGVAMYFEGNF
jgi:hypothetical protein